ncbi:unnamed protein product [Symbiodinium sp. CCMP2456]|nr:unnamed protein product [Symbiodinium sp. CCMP2456]
MFNACCCADSGRQLSQHTGEVADEASANRRSAPLISENVRNDSSPKQYGDANEEARQEKYLASVGKDEAPTVRGLHPAPRLALQPWTAVQRAKNPDVDDLGSKCYDSTFTLAASTRFRKVRVSPPVDLSMPVVAAAADILGGLSDWQRSWCTEEVVSIYERGRPGDVPAAGQLLAKALRWRQQNEDILVGRRQPKWVHDCRVLTHGDEGHPLIYVCMRHQTTFCNSNDVEHFAVVMEAAVKEMPPTAQQVDWIMDFHGADFRNHLDPRVMISIGEMMQQPYRDRLRSVILVDFPFILRPMMNIALPFLPAKTRNKVYRLSADAAVDQIKELQGHRAAQIVQQVVRENRNDSGPGALPKSLPSETHFWKGVNVGTGRLGSLAESKGAPESNRECGVPVEERTEIAQ